MCGVCLSPRAATSRKATNHEHSLRNPTPIGRLEGTFVGECQPNASVFYNDTGGATEKFGTSSATTTSYQEPSDPTLTYMSYQADYTEYYNDNCNTRHSMPLFKSVTFGKAYFEGPNTDPNDPELHGTSIIRFEVDYSQWMFPADAPDSAELFQVLNKECPCGQTWGGSDWVKIKAGSCGPFDPNYEHPALCRLINGEEGWATYKYLKSHGNSQDQYVMSALSFNRNRAAQQVPESSPRVKTENGAVRDPALCGIGRWSECGGAIDDAVEKRCVHCIDLECTGCLYRLLEPDLTKPKFEVGLKTHLKDIS